MGDGQLARWLDHRRRSTYWKMVAEPPASVMPVLTDSATTNKTMMSVLTNGLQHTLTFGDMAVHRVDHDGYPWGRHVE